MHRIPLFAVQVGSVLAEPILANGNELYPADTVLTIDVKECLLQFDVKEVVVKSYLDNFIPEDTNTLEILDDLTLSRLRKLNVEDIVAFSTLFVQDVISSASDGLLLKLCEYDITTYQHSINVAYLSCLVGIRYGMSLCELRSMTLGALFHDIGKYGIPLSILNKNGKLTNKEYALMQRHPSIGVSLARSVGYNDTILESVILEHHENYDGTGYPRRKAKNDISVYGQIAHMCDVYEALCAYRPYKAAYPKDIARYKMCQVSGTMFNPELLDMFLKIVPVYIAGEVLNICGHTGIVVTGGQGDNALVSCDHYLLSITEFYSMQNFMSLTG